MRILVEMLDPPGVEARRAALDAVNLVALVEQQFGEIGAVLTGHAGDQCNLWSTQGVLARLVVNRLRWSSTRLLQTGVRPRYRRPGEPTPSGPSRIPRTSAARQTAASHSRAAATLTVPPSSVSSTCARAGPSSRCRTPSAPANGPATTRTESPMARPASPKRTTPRASLAAAKASTTPRRDRDRAVAIRDQSFDAERAVDASPARALAIEDHEDVAREQGAAAVRNWRAWRRVSMSVGRKPRKP